MIQTIYDIKVNCLNGKEILLNDFRGKVLLIVNTACQCGFTPQYAGLQKLYETYHAQGLEILGFPCNQFGAQEPGNAEQIATFCETHYQVSFPLFTKIYVNGGNTHPLYGYLKSQAKGVLGTAAIKWNFTKFLVDRHGHVANRFAPSTKPENLTADIIRLLNSNE